MRNCLYIYVAPRPDKRTVFGSFGQRGQTGYHSGQAIIDMNWPCRSRPRLRILAVVVLLWTCTQQVARAQPGPTAIGTRYELAESVLLDRAESAVEKSLDRVKAYLADKRWEEAVETLPVSYTHLTLPTIYSV